MFINNNAKFCTLRIWKVSSPNILEGCKYAQEKIKTKNYTDEELKSESGNDNDNDADADTDNEEKIRKKSKSYSDNDE